MRWCGEEGEAVIELDAIDRFIEASARSVGEDKPGQGDANALEEFWKSSERREAERRRREIRAQWFAHFCRMADSHARLASEYERRAEALCEEGEQCA